MNIFKGKSISQVVLSWVIQVGAVAIPRTTSVDHIAENAELLGINALAPPKVR
jgi:diketogulonate reductase-like aldo/keto reductase